MSRSRDCLPQAHSDTRRGFTLVELLIAVTVLALALFAGLRSQTAAIELMREARETEVAIEVLREGMAQLMLEDNDELCDAGGSVAPGVALVTHDALPDQALTYTLPGYTEGHPVPDCLAMRLELQWTTSRGRTRTMTLVGAKR